METMLAGFLTVFGSGAVAVLLALLAPRFVAARTRRDLRVHGTLVSGIVAAMFTVTVALVVSFSWAGLTESGRDVRQEASALVDVYWYAQTLDTGPKNTVKGMVRDYTNEVITQEWPAMAARTELPAQGWRMVDRLRQQLEMIEPKGGGGTVRYSQALERLGELTDARRDRAVQAGQQIPSILWIGLLVGGGLVVAVPILLGNARPVVRATLAFTAAALVSFVIFLCYQINHPFSDGIRVSDDPYLRALIAYSSIDALWAGRG